MNNVALKKSKRKGKIKIRPEIFLMLIVLFALALRLYFFVGYNLSNDMSYVNYAVHIFDKGFLPADSNGVRIAFLYPVGLSLKVFGVSDLSAILYPLLTSILSIVLIFYFGKILISQKAGLLAAFFLSIYPLDIIYATQTMTDVPLSFLTALSALLFILGMRENNAKFFLLSGIVLGLAYLTNITGLLVLLFMAGYAAYTRKMSRSYAFVLIGFLLLFSLESVRYFGTSGDLLLRLKVVDAHYSGPDSSYNTDLNFYPNLMLNKGPQSIYGIFFYAFFISAAYFLWKRNKSTDILLIMFFSFFLYLQFGSRSFHEYMPIHKLDRLLSVLSVPMMLTISAFLCMLSNKKESPRFVLAVLMGTALSLTSLFYTYNIHQSFMEPMIDQKDIYLFSLNSINKTIYADRGTAAYLRFQYRFEKDGMIMPLSDVAQLDELRDSYVVVNGTRGVIETDTEHRYLRNPPSNWLLIKEFSNANQKIFSTFNPKIYYVPDTWRPL